MEKVDLHSGPQVESFLRNSRRIQVVVGRLYQASADVIGFEGDRFSGYFGIASVSEQTGEEISRKIRWLNDFSGNPARHTVTFRAETSTVIMIYRINTETPVRSRCRFDVTPIDDIAVKVSCAEVESFELVEDHEIQRPRELDESEEAKLEKNLVWVIGSPRGGTTWLGTQLLSYCTNVIDESQLGHHLGAIHGGFHDDTVRNLDHFRDDPHYVFSKRHAPTWKYFVRKLVLNRIYAEFPDAVDKVTVIKEPSSSMVADIISSCFQHSRIIFLFRDGRDVMDSMLKAFGRDGWMVRDAGVTPVSSAAQRMEFLRRSSMHWKKRTEVMLKAYGSHREDRRYLVRYEQLRRETAAELERIYGFLGIAVPAGKVEEIVSRYSFEGIPEEMRGDGKFYRSASPGRWKQNLSDEENATVDAIIGQTLRRLGYD